MKELLEKSFLICFHFCKVDWSQFSVNHIGLRINFNMPSCSRSTTDAKTALQIYRLNDILNDTKEQRATNRLPFKPINVSQ